MSVQVPEKWDSVKEHIAVLIEIADKLRASDKDWIHLKNEEDFRHHYGNPPLESLYNAGREFSGSFCLDLTEFENGSRAILLKDYVEHVQKEMDKCLPILRKTESEGAVAIREVDRWTYAIKGMHQLINNQIEFLQTVSETLKILRGTRLYLVETGQQLPYERPLKWWHRPLPVAVVSSVLAFLLAKYGGPILGWLAQLFSGAT